MKCKKNLGSQESGTETGMCNHRVRQVEMACFKDCNGSVPITGPDEWLEKWILFSQQWIINILLPYGHPGWNSEHVVHRVNSLGLFFIIKYFVRGLKFVDCHYCCVYYFDKSVSFLSCVATALNAPAWLNDISVQSTSITILLFIVHVVRWPI